MDILYLVDRLENLIASSHKMPLVNQIMVKESDMLMIIDQMRTAIPDEIKQARRIIQEKERILAQAQADAGNLLNRAREEAQADATHVLVQAREEAEQMLANDNLLRLAQERSEELMRLTEEHAQRIVHRAEEHTEQLQAEADVYAMETLRNLKEHLTSVETEVSRTILSIEKGLESLEIQQDQMDHMQAYQEEEYQEEGYQEDMEDVRSPSYFEPRKASLAVDTAGGPIYPA